MATSDDLLQDVYATFLSAYGQNQSGSNPNVLAFEAIGLNPGLTPGDASSSAAALQYVSTLADALPDLSSGTYERTMRTVSGTYSNMLGVASSTTQEAAPTFNAVKFRATNALGNSAITPTDGSAAFEPAEALPANWYDPNQQNGWVAYSFGTGAPAHPPVSPPRVPMRPLVATAPWRVMMAAPAAQAGAQAPAPQPVFAPSPTTLHRPPIFRLPPRVPVVPANPGSTAPPALHPSFAMSFDYCIVELNRPWLSGDFLASTGWYVPGAHQGDYASGPLAAKVMPPPGTSTPAGSATGPFAYVPTAFIAIRNLSIDLDAVDDGAPPAGTPVAFGPFSLANATGATNALSAPGIQIIGWICSVQPQLPPATDPALLAPPPQPTTNNTNNAGNVAGTIASDVGAVTGLIGELKGL